MTSDETRRRAAEHGVATSYRDWQGRQVEVGEATLTAILDALGDFPPVRPAEHRPPPATVATPPARTWGFAAQLYSVRSRQSWGHGDLADLAASTHWRRRCGARNTSSELIDRDEVWRATQRWMTAPG